MSVTIEKLDKPELEHIKMNCDNIISDKLTKYPMIEEAFSTTSFNVICGRMGSGKTSLLTSFVKHIFKKCFETIYVFMQVVLIIGILYKIGGNDDIMDNVMTLLG